jgi:hypothetical protein
MADGGDSSNGAHTWILAAARKPAGGTLAVGWSGERRGLRAARRKGINIRLEKVASADPKQHSFT